MCPVIKMQCCFKDHIIALAYVAKIVALACAPPTNMVPLLCILIALYSYLTKISVLVKSKLSVAHIVK